MADIATNGGNFFANLAAASPGDVLVLADGTYSPANINKTSSGAGVTFRPENEGGVTMSGALKIVGDYLHFEGIPFTGTLTLEDLHHSSFEYCRIAYMPVKNACSYLSFNYNRFTSFVQFQSTSDANRHSYITFHCNLWKYTTMPPGGSGNDWLQFQNGNHITITRNTFWDEYFYWDGTPGTNPHGDYIQIYSNGGSCDNIVVEYNWLWDSTATHANSADGVQGINLHMGEASRVRGNIVIVTHPNSIMLTDWDGTAEVEGNLILPGPRSSPYDSAYFTGGALRFNSQGASGTKSIRNSYVYLTDLTSGYVTYTDDVSGAATSDLDWSNNGEYIADYVPNDGGTLDVDQLWRDRVDEIINGTGDYYDPHTETVYLSGSPPPDPTPTTPTLPSDGQVILAVSVG